MSVNVPCVYAGGKGPVETEKSLVLKRKTATAVG